jgi:glycosyltransferase involved in cell wall biosynthesis
MQIDIHVHSKYSKRPSQWILKKIGCPESFTEPLQLYQIAKSRGMSHVTISDHNSIDGALEIAHLSDVFISEEITTYFPENSCKIHVLALNIDEVQHREIQRLRANIYDLAHYLRQENIMSIAAHPLYAINDRLTLAHFEQLLLLFQNFELNGARNPRENECLRHVLEQLTETQMVELADRHGFAPLFERSWEKKLWGGSDDHSALHIARTHTSIEGIEHPRLLMAESRNLELAVVSQGATPLTMGHNLYGIAYQYYRSKFNLERYADKDALMRFLDRNLRVNANNSQPGWMARLYLLWQYRKEKRAKTSVSDSLLTLLRHESWQLIQDEAEVSTEKTGAEDFTQREQHWFDFVNRASKRVMLHFGNHLLDHLSGANLFNVFSTIGSAGGLYTMLAPYFVAYAQFAKDRGFSETVRRHFDAPGAQAGAKHFKFAHFTDTYYEVNGVAQTLQQQVHFALKNHKDYTLITCDAYGKGDQPGVRNFAPIGTYELPEYPEQKIFYPPFLEMLAYCYDQNIDHIHSATPGPVGLAALAIARILKLPITGTYHTAIPQYAQILTGDEGIAELAWKYVLWYYDQMDVIYAPSQATRDELVSKGIHPTKVRVYPRGIDIERFHPAKRNGIFKKNYNLGEGTKLLYVGRVSKEKNLHLLAEAFERLVAIGQKVQLVVVGDGPYLEEMKHHLKGKPCCFTGYLQGEALAAVYASADLFVFPSTTDTFGNVVLEAQASGIPVIVSDQGGPCENILDGRTGTICKADDADSLLAAIRTLLAAPERRRTMGRAARQYLEERSFENAFLSLWEQYQAPMPAPAALRAAG